MPKVSPAGQKYTTDGKSLTWQPRAVDGVRPEKIRVSLRAPMKALRGLSRLTKADPDIDAIFMLIDHAFPKQADAITEMGLTEVADFVTAWVTELGDAQGASLGE